MLEHKTTAAGNPWRWFRQDPALASAMQAVLMTGEGGDIIAAMRAMSAQSVVETVAVAYGELCEEATRAYRAAQRRSEQWAFWQLILGVTTAGVIVLTTAAIVMGLGVAAASSSAMSLITGSAAMWFDRKVEENRKEAEARFQDMARYCTQSKLIMQISGVLNDLSPEQQEKVISAILTLRVCSHPQGKREASWR